MHYLALYRGIKASRHHCISTRAREPKGVAITGVATLRPFRLATPMHCAPTSRKERRLFYCSSCSSDRRDGRLFCGEILLAPGFCSWWFCWLRRDAVCICVCVAPIFLRSLMRLLVFFQGKIFFCYRVKLIRVFKKKFVCNNSKKSYCAI